MSVKSEIQEWVSRLFGNGRINVICANVEYLAQDATTEGNRSYEDGNVSVTVKKYSETIGAAYGRKGSVYVSKDIQIRYMLNGSWTPVFEWQDGVINRYNYGKWVNYIAAQVKSRVHRQIKTRQRDIHERFSDVEEEAQDE